MLELRKDIFADERDDNLKEIGKGTQRQDMLGHVTGTSTYFDDHKLQGMLHLKVLRSPHAHARLRRIDTTEAERAPGVRRVIRGADVPVNLNTLLSLINFGKDDEPSLAVDKVRYKGEPIVAIVADSPREAFEALAKVRVDYEPLPAVFDVEEALKPGAPVVNETYPKNTFIYHDVYDHQKLRFGDVERGFAEADHVLEQRYQMSPIEHAPTETNGSIAAPDTNGRYVVYTSTQALFFSLDTCAKILDVPSNTFHFIGGTVGGGFGGKVDTLTEPLAILGAMLTGRPVRYQLGREEEMQFGSPRGAERIYIKDGVMRDGRIVARKIRAYFDSGAYTRLSSYAVVKCAAHMPGPYTIPNVYGDIYCVFTNRTPATAMRGFGVTGDGLRARMPDGQARPSRRHRPDGVPHPQRLSRRRHEGAPARGQEHRADRMRPGRRREGQMAASRRGQAHVVAPRMAAAAGRRSRRRRASRLRNAPPFRSSAPATIARRLRRSSHRRPRRRRPLPRGHQLRRRRMAPPVSPPSSAPGGADHGKTSRTRHRVHQLSHRHEPWRRSQPGAGAFQSRAASSRCRCRRSISARA